MKTCLNESCGKDFEPNSTKQRFCSDRCRVAFNRAKKAKENLGDLGHKVTTANKIEVIEQNQLQAYQEAEYDRENGKRLRQFAAAKKINVEDLFAWMMNTYGVKPELGKGKGEVTGRSTNPRTKKTMEVVDGETVREAPSGESYLEKRRRLKQ